MNLNEIEHRIFEINSNSQFEDLAFEVFKYQFKNCSIYNQFAQILGKTPSSVSAINEFPFLPIEFFKSQIVKSGEFNEEIIFTSSGTTGNETSKHYIKSLKTYEKSFLTWFNNNYPQWEESIIIGLLPSYLERSGSSLIYMVNHLVESSKNDNSSFHLKLNKELKDILESDEPKILFGVTFALLELCETSVNLNNTIIIETGGMKGRGKELTREELHLKIQSDLNPKAIHSEYGMTELQSQGYLKTSRFEAPNWMKVLVRETTDPLTIKSKGKGAITVIDLANIHSCSFIATDDLGSVDKDGLFTISGRIDHAQIRGCNLLAL